MGVLTCISSYSQSVLHVFEDWSTTLGSQNFFHKNVTKVDASNNVYIAGATLNALGDYDILVAKYNSSGVLQWVNQYSGLDDNNDVATDLVVDGSGNVYITGEVVDDTVSGYSDVITIKYNSSGTQQWLRTWDGIGGPDAGTSLVLDASGNVYVGGGTANGSGNSDMLGIKYNNSGTLQFASTYNGVPNLHDAVLSVKLNSTQFLLAGPSQQDSVTFKQLGVKLNITTGAFISATLGPSGSTAMDILNDIFRDASGNFYFVGAVPTLTQGYDINVIKLSSTMSLTWQSTYNGSDDLDDVANGLRVDASGNVYVTGYTTDSTEQKNMITIKYNSSGAQQWVEVYNDSLNGNDAGNDIDIDGSGNIYVAGYDSTAIQGTDYYTVKYNNSGTEIWSIRHDGDAHSMDKATNIVKDASGDIVVTGESQKLDGTLEYKTVKYVEHDVVTPTDYDVEVPTSAFLYYQNKGQLLGTDTALVPSIKYYTHNTFPSHFIKNLGSSFVFSQIDTLVATTDTLHRIDVTFDQVNSDAMTYKMEEINDGYLNYHLPHIPDGVTMLRPNKRLITKDLYPNIDLEYSSNQNGIKYYFIVKPGGDPDDIQITYVGASSFNLNGGTNELTINSSVGSIAFDRPTAYQLTAGNVVDSIVGWTADWQTNGASNKYKFNSGVYDSTETLVIAIDQGNAVSTAIASYKNLTWSTYYGAGGDDNFLDVVSDGKDVYTGVKTLSTNFPVTTGVLSNPLGSSVAGVVKFRRSGVRVYSTYYGNTTSNNPIINGAVNLAVDPQKKVYITGTVTRFTGSSMDIPFPATPPPGAYVDNTLGGGVGSDIFLTQLDSFGILRWTTYYGDAGDDWYPDVNVDFSGDIYLTFQGYSDSLKQKVGAYWDSTNSGSVIVKFNSSLQRTWATAFSGLIERGAFDKVGNYYLTGTISTGTTGVPWTNPGGMADFDTTLNGALDIYTARFSKTASALQWLTSFGGSGIDGVRSIALDLNDNIYLTGYTYSGDFPYKYVGPGTYCDSTLGGTRDAFLFRYSNSLSRQWGSYFGGADNTETGWDVTTCPLTAQVFFTGYTADNAISFFGSTPYYSQSYGGSVDGYVLTFSENIAPMWSTYLGYSSYDIGYSVAVNNFHELFLAGYTSSDQTGNFLNIDPGSGAWFVNSRAVGSGSLDAHISRFTIDSVVTGIHESIGFNPDMNLIVYPNPSSGQFNYSFVTAEKVVYFKVYNIVGQLVFVEKVETNAGLHKGSVDMSSYTNGTYFVVAETISGRAVKKAIKQD